MKKLNGISILSHEKRQARMTFTVPLGESYRVSGAPLAPDVLAALNFNQDQLTQANKDRSVNSFFLDTNVTVDSSGDRGPKFETYEDVKPKDTDYIYPLFRALSATLIEGHWIDFSMPGVLEESVPLLQGQTVFKNHCFDDVEAWIGAVNQSVWDAKGDAASGTPGINAELKIDWKVKPLIARGLLMQPPAIHSVSVTVLTEWDYSHPKMAADDKWKFYEMLGEEVDGEIVRFIVTKVLAYWEISLVFQGADVLAKQSGDVSESEREEDEFAARASRTAPRAPALSAPAPAQPVTNSVNEGPTPTPSSGQTPKESNTVKLTAEQKKILGLEAHTEDEISDEVVLAAIDRLAQEATSGRELEAAARQECLRFARLAELGAADGDLPKAVEKVVNASRGTDLAELSEEYRKKAEARFTLRCQKCGSTEIDKRSSVEAQPKDGQYQHSQKTRRVSRPLH